MLEIEKEKQICDDLYKKVLCYDVLDINDDTVKKVLVDALGQYAVSLSISISNIKSWNDAIMKGLEWDDNHECVEDHR